MLKALTVAAALGAVAHSAALTAALLPTLAAAVAVGAAYTVHRIRRGVRYP